MFLMHLFPLYSTTSGGRIVVPPANRKSEANPLKQRSILCSFSYVVYDLTIAFCLYYVSTHYFIYWWRIRRGRRRRFSLEKFLQERIKVGSKAGSLGDSITITRDRSKITVTSDNNFSKQYSLRHASLGDLLFPYDYSSLIDVIFSVG
ncbi:60S ribosomal protein L22-2 [Glycine soja]|uniref:Large ribosomal subunit protein eL22 n=1 Tax=Glycine soja TaxID=3848 RepID=A0A445F1L2_GLYSO|nr:60S ribosomal protein L22-2 [Glycine soja]